MDRSLHFHFKVDLFFVSFYYIVSVYVNIVRTAHLRVLLQNKNSK